MAGFYPSHVEGGHGAVARKDGVYVPLATALVAGVPYRFVAGTGVAALAAPAVFNEAIFGVAAHAKAANVGTEVSMFTDPNIVYQYKPTLVVTATGGNATTFVCNALPNVNNLFTGGYIEVVTCAAGLPRGRVIPITGYTGATGTITVAAQPFPFAAGDTVYIYPGKLCVGYTGFSMNAGATEINFATTNGRSLLIYDVDPDNKLVFVKFLLYQQASQITVFA